MKYEKLTQQEHVLKRPDMYIGNMNLSDTTTYIYDEVDKQIVQKEISITDGLLRIFIEPLSNAIDNVVRSREMGIAPKYIKVDIEDSKISITNDGYTIPIKLHETDDKTYIPEMLFGQLLTSSNYDDTEQRYTSGKNGIGVSCTNLFSTMFEIECADTLTSKKYSQTWTNNMSVVSKPHITSFKNKNGYTKVSWVADFPRFGVTGYSSDIINLFKRYVIDTGMITKLDVYFNGEKFAIKTLLDYAKLFKGANTDELCYFKDDKYEIVLGSSLAGNFEQISFVNGINTVHGGVHVDSAVTTLLKPICDKLTKAKKDVSLKEIKSLFTLWTSVDVPNPEFSSQSKTKLTAPNIKIKPITPAILSKIMKWEYIADGIETFVNVKDISSLKKTEKKTKVFKAIKGYDPANLIKKKPLDCTLILCEGLSAKTFAVTGITVGLDSKKGRDYWGIYALRGKLLNTRNAATAQISKNKEIVDMIQILNLKFDVDYSDQKEFDTLNYGKVLIITDQDTDGFHITGLIMNFFHSMFPSLFYKPGFLSSMFTPIMNVTVGKKVLRFYNLDDAVDFLKSAPKNASVKYLKGLGSSSDNDIKETFGKLMIKYEISSKNIVNKEMDKIFHSKFAEDRKEWLRLFTPKQTIMNVKGFVTEPVEYTVPYESFLNVEMIKYSMEDCIRNLPNIFDGLKQSQRKILYSFILKGDSVKMKVSQWAGFVSEKSCYHHGEQCLFDTIIKMAQDFMGSNNLPLIQKDGQFGSRLNGGKDAASSRYIFAKTANVVKYIFRPEDECILDYQNDDGNSIEPVNYLPIIPMLLVNGSVAIATGWSTNIPCFNPVDIIDWLKNYIMMGQKTELKPWYKNFTGTIDKVEDNKYIATGIIEKHGKVWVIKELPVGVWIDNYKQILEELLELKKIKSLKNYCTTDKIHFEIEMIEQYANLSFDKVVEFFGLTSTLNLNNMVVLSKEGVTIERFKNVDDILTTFANYRLKMYEERKKLQLEHMQVEMRKYKNKQRFITLIIDGELKLNTLIKTMLVSHLENQQFYKYDDSYNYLINIPVFELTTDYIESLQKTINNLQTKHDKLQYTTCQNLWFGELDELKSII